MGNLGALLPRQCDWGVFLQRPNLTDLHIKALLAPFPNWIALMLHKAVLDMYSNLVKQWALCATNLRTLHLNLADNPLFGDAIGHHLVQHSSTYYACRLWIWISTALHSAILMYPCPGMQ